MIYPSICCITNHGMTRYGILELGARLARLKDVGEYRAKALGLVRPLYFFVHGS